MNCCYYKFNIFPQAFFQVNTKAAEILYKQVGELAELKESTTLVDVCCGCGTIGLCLADKVKQVSARHKVPVECPVPEAVSVGTVNFLFCSVLLDPYSASLWVHTIKTRKKAGLTDTNLPS